MLYRVHVAFWYIHVQVIVRNTNGKSWIGWFNMIDDRGNENSSKSMEHIREIRDFITHDSNWSEVIIRIGNIEHQFKRYVT